MLLIACAVVFLVALFVLKNGLPFQNQATYQSAAGLTYDPNETIKDLVNQDTDGDGIPDWQERLWGTDPTKAETTPGIPDSVAIAKLKAAQATSDQTQTTDNSPITKTDQFSRDLFATIAATTQNGQPLDQATIDQISSSIIDNVQNAPQKKVYVLADLKIALSDNLKAIQIYSNTLTALYKKYPIDGNIQQILQEFAPDPNAAIVNPDALLKLTPIITQTKARMNALATIPVPESIATVHLALLNAGEKLMEDISNIQLYNTDVIVSLGAASEYEQDSDALGTAVANLNNTIKLKLSN